MASQCEKQRVKTCLQPSNTRLPSSISLYSAYTVRNLIPKVCVRVRVCVHVQLPALDYALLR